MREEFLGDERRVRRRGREGRSGGESRRRRGLWDGGVLGGLGRRGGRHVGGHRDAGGGDGRRRVGGKGGTARGEVDEVVLDEFGDLAAHEGEVGFVLDLLGEENLLVLWNIDISFLFLKLLL